MSRVRRSVIGLAWVALVLGAHAPSLGHPLDPALLELRQEDTAETDPGTWTVLWRVPRGQPRQAPLEPVLPDLCTLLDQPVATVGSQHLSWQVGLDCPAGDLTGVHIGVEGLESRETEVLVRLHRTSGEIVQAVLRAEEPSFIVPAARDRWQTLRSYGRLGVGHILGGTDHLLFVLGLLFLVPGLRALLLTVTAFTVGHSITLSLAALGWFQLPSAPVELAIAFSIWLVAVRIANTTDGRFDDHTAWPIAIAFGWLHGLGFAGALAETGLPQQHVPLALLAFNVGIEVGQLVFIAAVLGLVAMIQHTVVRHVAPTIESSRSLRMRLALPAAYVIGSLAGYWMIDRAWGWLGATL